jgi:hypothetical protein
MKPIKGIVIFVTLFVLFYSITPHIGVAENVIFSLFLIANVFLFYLVYAVLVKGKDSGKKFSEGHWYDDVDKTYSKDA